MRMWRKETLRKAMSMLLCLVMVLGMLPVPVLAEEIGCTVADCTGSYVEGMCNVCGSSETPAVPEEKQVCSHSGGTATCKDLAVCEKCGTAYGERVAHSFDADGKCSCGAECEHAYADGKCIVCSKAEPCTHEGGIATCTEQAICMKCDTAYGERTAHSYGTDGLCTCGAECEHNYAEGKCTACGMAESVPVDPAVEAVKEQIEALPTVEEFVAMRREEQTAIHDGAYMAAGNAYNALTEEQKASLDVAKLMALAAWFADPNNAVPAVSPNSGSCGEGVQWALLDGTLTISGNGEMNDYGESSDGRAPWYGSRISINTLVINSGVTAIGANAFLDLTGITTVVIPDTVISIGTQAFYNCASLTSVTYNGLSNPAAVGSKWIFFGCSNLSLSGKDENGRQLYNIFVPATYQDNEFCGQPIPAENKGFTYSITVAAGSAATVSPASAKQGETITVSCPEGQILHSVNIVAANGELVTATKQEDGTFTFSMPDCDVTITAIVLSENDEALWGTGADALTNSGTLLDAGDAAESGSAAYIKLLKDVERGNDFHLKPTGELTFDLNGKNFDIHGAIWVDTGTVKFINADRVTSTLMRPLWVCSGAAATVSDGTWTGTHYAAYNQGSLTVTNATMLATGQSFDAHIYSANNLTIGTGVTFQGASAKGNIQYDGGTVTINHVSETLTTIHPTAAVIVGTDIILPSGYVIYDTSKDSPVTVLEANKSYNIGKPDPQVKYGGNMETAVEGSWADAINSEAPYIQLLKDIELKDGNPMTIGSGKTVTLDLNSHDLIQTTSGKFVIKVDGGSLTLTGSGNVTHNYSDSNTVFGSGVWIFSGSLNMTGGTITGNHANGDNGGGIYMNGGTLTMSGGEISGNTAGAGGGIFISSGGEATVSGTAEIKSNRASSTSGYGGGICVGTGGTLNLSGGIIADNTSSGGYGGGIAVLGTCNLSGNPVVENNVRNSSGDNLYVANGAPIIINGKLDRYTLPRIGVTPYAVPFTSGWAAQMTDENGTVASPEYYFKSDDGRSVYLSGDEAVVGSLTPRDLTVTKKNNSGGLIVAPYGDTITLVATPSAGGGTISWILGNEIVATGGEYAFTSNQIGYTDMTVTISADTNGTVKYASVTKDFSVYGASKKLTAADITLVLPQNAAYAADREWEASITRPADFEDGTVELRYYREGETTPITGKLKDAGTYIVEVVVKGSTNYSDVKLGDDAWRFTISPATTELSLKFDDNLTYTGDPIPVRELKVNGADYKGEVTYSFTGTSDGQQVSGEGLPRNAGTYTITASSPRSGNYGAGETSATVTIGKAGIDPVVSITGWDYGSYSAEKNAPTVSGNSGGGDVTYTYKVKNANDDTYSTTVPAVVGEYTVRVAIAETANYLGGEAAADFTIGKATIDPKVSITGWTYGEVAKAPTVTGNTGNGNVTYTYKAKDAGDSTYSTTVPTNAGEYTVRAAIAECDNYAGGEASANFIISKAGIKPTVSIIGWDFGDTANTPTVTGNPGKGGVTYAYKAWGADDSSYVDTVPSAAGSYTVKATVAESANYLGGEAAADFAIGKAAIHPSVSITSWTYGEDANAPTVSGNTGNGTVIYTYKVKNANDNTYSTTAPTDAGEYTVRATVAATANYAGGEAAADFTIRKAEIAPIVSIASWKFGAEANPPSVTGNPGKGGVTYAYKTRGADDSSYVDVVPSAAGSYTVKATIAETDNYLGSEAAADFTIGKASIHPSVSITGWTYGEDANAPAVSGNTGDGGVTYQYKDKNADDSTYTTTVPSDAGLYTVKATVAATANYTGGTDTADFSISKADISPVVSITGWDYGAAANTPTVSNNPGNGAVSYKYKLQSADDNAYSEEVPTVVGYYTVRATVAATSNYNGGTAVANFSISKADITPTVSITGWTYGDTANDPSVADNTGNGVVTYRYKAKSAGDNTYTEKVPTDAGDYTVKAAIAETEYYAAGTATADFTIARKPVTVFGITAKDKIYDGQTNADLDCAQAALNGKLDRDTLTVTAVGTFADENVGTNKTVSITDLVLGGASVDNYVLAVTGQQTAGIAAITPREITVEITSNGGTYGGTIIAAAAEVKNAVSGENPAVTLTYTGNAYNSQTTPTNAGKYTVTATISDTNYILTGSITAEFVVAKATVEVPAIASKVYNGAVRKADVTATDKYSVAENNGGTEIGDYTVVLNLTYPDNYKWEDSEEATKTLTFKITPRVLQDADVTLTADLTYNAKTQEPSVTVKDGESVLAKDTHYTVTYEKVGPNDSGVPMNDKPVDAGDYNAVITGIGSCDGTVKKSFRIKPSTTITVVPETLTAETYTGEEIKPEITVKGADNQELVKNTDYTIAYQSNTNAGAAKVIITGIGNYAGAEKELTFTVKAKELTDANVFIEETVLPYREGQTTVPEITVKDGSKTLVKDTDYVVVYKDKNHQNVDAPSEIGTYTAEVAGIAALSEDGNSTGNYTGIVSKTFVITDDVTDPEITGVTNGKTYYTTQKAIAKDTNLASVTKNGTEISPVVPAGTEVTLQGNTTATYTVTAVDIAELDASVTINMKPISTLDDATENLTVDNVNLSDKDTIQAVLDKVNPIRKDECGNATQAETDALDAVIQKCNDLLKVITDAEDAISKIQAMPNPAETAPDNETAVKAYDEAKKTYDALPEHGKELVGTETKAKLDAMLKALTAYDVIQGHKSSYSKGSGKAFSITANGYFGKFTGLKVDGKLLDSKYYTAQSGSTVVSLKNSYLNSLADGKHTIEFLYTDGSTGGDHYFRISGNNGSPFTGDNNHIMMFSGIMMISLLGMVMMVMFAPKKKGKYQR